MLIEFTIKNYRSIKEEQVFSMVKGKGDELSATNSFTPDVLGSTSLLRSSAIYGANAAGKSNIIRAMMDMGAIIRGSASASQAGDAIPLTPFLFDKQTSTQPTEFEATFISEGIRYQYGFSATSALIVEEWLIAYPKGRAQRWFTRIFDEETKSSLYKFSDHLTGKKSVWQEMTRNNALFLSTAIQLNSKQLDPVYSWFQYVLRPTRVGGWSSDFTASLCENAEQKKKVLAFLKAADFDIHDLQIETEKFDPSRINDDYSDELKEKIINEMKDENVISSIKSIHKTDTGDLVELDLEEESDGTQMFFSFVGPWLDSLENGYVLVIDELHNNLHPKMVSYLVGLFHSNETNPNNAQLIFTTHETSILSQDVFRRDQVWFCEKDKTEATQLYPLTDFSPRKDRENIGLSYLAGRYGALPFTKSLIIPKEL